MNRSIKTRCRLSWLGLFAIALVAIAPTVSQLRAAARTDISVTHASNDGHAAHHHTSSSDPHAHEHDGKSPNDCWSKCGYCDFLGHTPTTGSIDYLPAFIAAHTASTYSPTVSREAYFSYAQAAYPRGPPPYV